MGYCFHFSSGIRLKIPFYDSKQALRVHIPSVFVLLHQQQCNNNILSPRITSGYLGYCRWGGGVCLLVTRKGTGGFMVFASVAGFYYFFFCASYAVPSNQPLRECKGGGGGEREREPSVCSCMRLLSRLL